MEHGQTITEKLVSGVFDGDELSSVMDYQGFIITVNDCVLTRTDILPVDGNVFIPI